MEEIDREAPKEVQSDSNALLANHDAKCFDGWFREFIESDIFEQPMPEDVMKHVESIAMYAWRACGRLPLIQDSRLGEAIRPYFNSMNEVPVDRVVLRRKDFEEYL